MEGILDADRIEDQQRKAKEYLNIFSGAKAFETTKDIFETFTSYDKVALFVRTDTLSGSRDNILANIFLSDAIGRNELKDTEIIVTDYPCLKDSYSLQFIEYYNHICPITIISDEGYKLNDPLEHDITDKIMGGCVELQQENGYEMVSLRGISRERGLMYA